MESERPIPLALVTLSICHEGSPWTGYFWVTFLKLDSLSLVENRETLSPHKIVTNSTEIHTNSARIQHKIRLKVPVFCFKEVKEPVICKGTLWYSIAWLTTICLVFYGIRVTTIGYWFLGH